jgi:uncharacterized protein YqgV (UPF0045/DUF77 family)
MSRGFNVNLALQVLPLSGDMDKYAVIDKAIALIQQSGFVYQVCPFETVVEGDYEGIIKLVGEIKDLCIREGVIDLIMNIKLQVAGNRDVYIDDKMNQYK